MAKRKAESLRELQQMLRAPADFMAAIQPLKAEQLDIVRRTLAGLLENASRLSGPAREALSDQAFRHGFIIGALNGAQAAVEQIGQLFDEDFAQRLLDKPAARCQFRGCVYFRPGAAGYCSEECVKEEKRLASLARAHEPGGFKIQ